MTLEIFLGLSLIFNILLGIGVRNLLRQNHQLEDAVLNERDTIHREFSKTLETLREIDSKGAFESDDEVGAIFNDIKQAITELGEKI